MKTKTFISVLMIIASFLMINFVITGAQDIVPQVWLSPDGYQAHAGEEFTVTINIGDASGVYGGSFLFSFDPQVLEVVVNDNHVITPGDFFQDRPSFMLKNSVNAQDGTIEYALTLTQPAEPVNGGGVVGTITFRALTDAIATITPTQARLLSPDFTEVDGRMVAQSISEVDAGLQGIEVTVGNTPVTSGYSEAPLTAPQNADAMTIVNGYDEPALVLSKTDVVVLAVAGMFFIGGLGLFAITIGMYAKLNVGISPRRRSEQYL
jgi:hypothetical protein